MTTLGFVPTLPYAVPVAKAAISVVARVYASAVAVEFLWRRFSPRDRNQARAFVESALGPLPADAPDIPNGGGNIWYWCQHTAVLTGPDGVDPGYPWTSSPYLRRGPLRLYFESINGGSSWKLEHTGTGSPSNVASTTKKIEDGWFMNIASFSAIPRYPEETDQDLDNDNFIPRRPTPQLLREAAAAGINRTPGGTFQVEQQLPDGFPPVTFEFGAPEFDGQRLRQPLKIPRVRTGDGRSASPGVNVDFDFTSHGQRRPVTGSTGLRMPAPSINNPNPLPTPIPNPIQTERRSRPPTYTPAPGVEVRLDWTPPDIRRILTPPDLDDPPPFPEWIPELLEEFQWQPDPEPRTTVTTDKCPDPCPPILPSICRFEATVNDCDPDEEDDKDKPHITYLDGAQVILQPHYRLAHITEIYLPGENLFVPRLATARWVTGDGSMSPDIDIKSRVTYLVAPSPAFFLLQVNPYGDTAIVQVRRKFRVEKEGAPPLYFWEDEDNPYDVDE